MTQKSCAVGMRNAIPRNYLKWYHFRGEQRGIPLSGGNVSVMRITYKLYSIYGYIRKDNMGVWHIRGLAWSSCPIFCTFVSVLTSPLKNLNNIIRRCWSNMKTRDKVSLPTPPPKKSPCYVLKVWSLLDSFIPYSLGSLNLVQKLIVGSDHVLVPSFVNNIIPCTRLKN